MPSSQSPGERPRSGAGGETPPGASGTQAAGSPRSGHPFRIVGIAVLVAGSLVVLQGLASFFGGVVAEDFDPTPDRFWLTFLGLPVMGVGAWLMYLEGSRPGHPASAPVEMRRTGISDPEVGVLVGEVQAEYVEIYGGEDATPLREEEFEPPRGSFFVAYRGGRPVGMGGWRFRPDVTGAGGERAAEVKRMYVAPWARRTGVARAVLARLEQSAREAGADVMILETGMLQPAAVALYRAAGYADTERFGFYAESPHTVYLARRL